MSVKKFLKCSCGINYRCGLCGHNIKSGQWYYSSVTTGKTICADCKQEFIEIRKADKELELELSKSYRDGFRDGQMSLGSEDEVPCAWGFDIVIDGLIVTTVIVHDSSRVEVNPL